jgi:hypothetical protein
VLEVVSRITGSPDKHYSHPELEGIFDNLGDARLAGSVFDALDRTRGGKVSLKEVVEWAWGIPGTPRLPSTISPVSQPALETKPEATAVKADQASAGEGSQKVRSEVNVNVWVEEPWRRGISMGQLEEFFKKGCGVISYDEKGKPCCFGLTLARMCMEANVKDKPSRPYMPNLYSVNHFYIKPDTLKDRVSYSEFLNPKGLDIDYFISHHWAEDFEEFIQSTLNHALSVEYELEKKWREIAYWCCAFANNQHDVQLGDTVEESPFYKALSWKHNRGTVMNLNWMVSAFTRIWCIYEVFLTHDVGKPFTINTKHGPLVGGSSSVKKDNWVVHMNNLLQFVDAAGAESSSQEDKDSILKVVGGFEGKGVAEGFKGAPALNLVVRSKLAGQAMFSLAVNGKTEAVVKALESRADPNKKDGRGVAPLTYAAAYKHNDLVELLRKAGADQLAEASAQDVVEMWAPNAKDDVSARKERFRAIKAVRKLKADNPKAAAFHEVALKLAETENAGLCRKEFGIEVHNNPDPGQLCYVPTNNDTKKAMHFIDRLHRGAPLSKILRDERLSCRMPKPDGDPDGDKSTLMLFFTDCEPDDVMGIAQLWQLKHDRGELAEMPIIVMVTDFEGKDNGTVFEKKLLVISLMLGLTEEHICIQTRRGAAGRDGNASPHPLTASMEAQQEASLNSAIERIARFRGRRVDVYGLAPGHGIIGAFFDGIQQKGAWPARTWFVSTL